MLSKAEAGYRAPEQRYPCMMCRRFDGYVGACSIVEGTVRPDATCDQWRNMRAERPSGADSRDSVQEFA